MQVSRVGGEILVNTATAGNQYDQQGTALANGDFVLTWRDGSLGVGGATGDTSGFAVKAQVFDANGAPVGGEIRVNTATAGDQDEQKVTALANGDFVVTWTDSSQGIGGATGDTSGFAVKAQLFSAAGTPVGSEILVNTVTGLRGGFNANSQYQPEIVALADGRFVISWWDTTGGDASVSRLDIKAQVFNADGTRVGDEFLVNTATAQDQYAHKMTALSNGGFVVTWQDESQGVGGATGDTSSSAVKAQVFDAAGTPVGSEILVNTVTHLDQQVPEITALANGEFVVTWRDGSQGFTSSGNLQSDYDVRAQVFDASGAHVGSEILVNTATFGVQEDQKITALAGGGFVVTWESGNVDTAGDGSGAGIKAQVFDASGAHVGSEILVNTATAGNQAAPEITALSNGDFVVTWDDGSMGVGGATGDTDSSAIKAQVFDASGARIGGEILVNTDTAGAQQFANVIALPGGKFAVSWTSGDGDSIGVKTQIFSVTDGSTTPTETYLGPPHLPDGASAASGAAAPAPSIFTVAANADAHADSPWQSMLEQLMDGSAQTAAVVSQAAPAAHPEHAPPDFSAGPPDLGWLVH
jgi:hypothetical protein